MQARKMAGSAGLFLSLWLCLSLSLAAEPARAGWYLDQNAQAAWNPLGIQLGTQLVRRFPLIHKPGILWESTKVDVGVTNTLSPAFDFVGGLVDIEPIAIFDLALTAQAQGYFSALGYGFHSRGGYDAAFDQSALNALPSKNATGYCLAASPTLKCAFGPLAIADTFSLLYFDVDGGSGYFYETVANCILAKRGVELTNQAYILFDVGHGLRLGLNDSLLRVPDSGYESHAVHAIAVYSSTIDSKTSLYAALLLGGYLADRYLADRLHAAGTVGLTLAL